jgi:membrane-associated phospholipid phosphatase
MNDILAWGLDVVRVAQRASSPALTAAMKAITLLGTEWFFLAAIPAVYWCVDKRRGARLGLLVFVSAFCNAWLKVVFAQPRPFQLDPSVGLASETSYGLPSGHAQGTATFWGAAAPLFRRPWGLALALLLPLVVGLSRVYLGVHFPTDLFAGWALGALFVAVEAFWGDRTERFLAGLRPQLRLAAAAAVALGMNALFEADTSLSGVFFGFGAGLAYAPQAAPFSSGGALPKRAARYLFGLATVVVLYVGPKLLLGVLGSQPLVRFLRYAVVGAWGALGAPWLFLRLGLAEREAPAQSESV